MSSDPRAGLRLSCRGSFRGLDDRCRAEPPRATPGARDPQRAPAATAGALRPLSASPKSGTSALPHPYDGPMELIALNLAVGAIGALIGALAAYRLQVRESRRLDRGAARALYMELAGNQTAARHGGTRMDARPPFFDLRRDVYTEEIARLGAYLTPQELLAVTWAYALLPAAETALESLQSGGGARGDDPERAVLLQLAAEIEHALVLLQPRVWTEAERRTLEQGIPGRQSGSTGGPPAA